MTFEDDYIIDIEEIGRHLATENGDTVTDFRQYAINYLGSRYVARNSDDFQQKQNGLLVFIGGDESKVGIPDRDGVDDGKVSFSMSDGPPNEA